jgi:hypothetical protein
VSTRIEQHARAAAPAAAACKERPCRSPRRLTRPGKHPILVQDAPFFVEKLQVRMLPCVVMFVGGVAVDRIVGFDTLGAADDFPTTQVKHTRFQSARAPGGRHGCSVPLRAAPPPLPP